jgi:meiotic recombination protein REC8
MNGQIREIPASEREARRASSVHPHDSGSGGHVRKEHGDTMAERVLHIFDRDGDVGMMNFGDDAPPDAAVLPVMSGGLGLGDQPHNLDDVDHIFSELPDASLVSAEAKQKKTRAKKVRTITLDKIMEIRNSDLNDWQVNYIDNMAAASLIKTKHTASTQGKKNAFHFVYGTGLNDVGGAIGKSTFISPLAQFAGVALLATLIGAPASKKTKRKAVDNAFDTPKKAARTSDLGRGQFLDDGLDFNVDDDPFAIRNRSISNNSVEVGRDAPSALADYTSSAMPWNMSASANSHQRALSSMSKLPGSRRLTAQSPLIGRGSNVPGELEMFSQLMDVGDAEEMVIYGRSDSLPAGGGHGTAGGYSSSHGGGMINPGEDFEHFGPAAFVDTQTAANSQWVKAALDRESNNFLEYVKNTIAEKAVDELCGGNETQVSVEAQGNSGKRVVDHSASVTFEKLFEEGKHSKVVASQAFYQILCLATKKLIWVDQEFEVGLYGNTGEEYIKEMGAIKMGVVASA